MKIDVRNEVGRLREVLVHRPGEEIVRMTQHDLDRMLFDDILAWTEAGREHDLLADIMRAAGAHVYELSDLLRNALAAAPPDAIHQLVQQCCELAGSRGIAEDLCAHAPERLAQELVAGVYWRDIDPSVRSLARIRAELIGSDQMALRPLPNLMFLRDPCISVHDRVVVGRMATSARAREPLLVAFALRHAPTTGAALSFSDPDALDESFDSVEGGDVLVLSERLLLIGCSERTNPQTLERLASELFSAHAPLERIYAVMMPSARSVMHLDTILTQVDESLFLGHAPLIEGTSLRPALPVARLTRDALPELVRGASTLDILREELGPDVKLVPCGGTDPLHQEREQWTDGANAVALGPGRIILYARNTKTIEALGAHGFEEVRLGVAQAPEERSERIRAAMTRGRTVFSFSGSELSRARGGGRCLTMPLARDEVKA